VINLVLYRNKTNMIKSKAAASELFGWEDFVPKLNDVVIN
jgi:hypothetical protein